VTAYWIGGGTGAGKSTIARRIAEEHGLRLYATDDVMAEHARRSTAEDSPLLDAFIGMDMDERWVNRTPLVMYETFHWFRGEGFQLIVDDLRRMEPGVVVEGFRLLPHLVRPLLGEPPRAVWLLPSDGFRRAAFDSRGSTWQIARKTSDPERALRNLLERDRIFTDWLRAETRGLPVIEVDGQSEDELTAQVEWILGCGEGPGR
jgi:2-phosphoglycerate kinase